MATNIKMTSVDGVTLYTKDKYVADDIYVSIDGADKIIPENIAKDVNILGVVGTYEGGSSGDTLSMLLDNTLTSYSNSDITKIKDYLFKENTELKSVSFPNVTSISTYAFSGCSSLTNVSIPKINSLGTSCFASCKSLTQIHLFSVSNFGNSVFANCTALTDIYNGCNGVIALNSMALKNITAGLKIHVRPEYADQYATATNWSALIEAGTVVIVGDYTGA